MDDREIRLKRARLRSWRRGIKEMDLILGPFADEALSAQSDATLDVYERLLDENDHDLYQWVTARTRPAQAGSGVQAAAGPAHLHPLLDLIAGHAANRMKKSRDL
ncbi:succinate dehydrogenase assembly factor 2 [uncultured Paracoccus sp.]|uniref:FAD assembly factor SdhE n=1 Tax=uncultured Paracoccus sp. TaxID=189685 RepID=UPI00260E3781|nr:succinate dehydrogenase assembly factor 2 [uncultured Paracoccus sp.]